MGRCRQCVKDHAGSACGFVRCAAVKVGNIRAVFETRQKTPLLRPSGVPRFCHGGPIPRDAAKGGQTKTRAGSVNQGHAPPRAARRHAGTAPMERPLHPKSSRAQNVRARNEDGSPVLLDGIIESMERIPEPELMEDAEQARAYAAADFADVNQGFVDRFCAAFPELVRGRVVDLGCGPADIPLRLFQSRPALRIVAVDGSAAMLDRARQLIGGAGARRSIDLVCAGIADLPFRSQRFDAVISNSLLHHLHDPVPFWEAVRRLGRPGAAVFVMDLFRPETAERAREIVAAAAARESPILQRDFYHSLLAAFTPEEVRAQLPLALRHLDSAQVSERHWLVWGRV